MSDPLNSGWIKLEKSCLLPKDGECVIIGNSLTGDVGEARYRIDGSIKYFEKVDDKYSIAVPAPTHWMPLPIPPTE